MQKSSFCDAFLGSRLLNDFLSSFIVAYLKLKELDKPLFLVFISLILGWNYIQNKILLLRFVTLVRLIWDILNSKLMKYTLKGFATWSPWEMISSPSTRVIFECFLILSNKKDFTVFQKQIIFCYNWSIKSTIKRIFFFFH